jgi:predicted TPR repeat methyltransferase
MELSTILREAVALHQEGRLEEAQAMYGMVLALDPRQFDALHLSGVIERQSGNPERAAALIREALQVDASQARAHCNLGAALQDLGQPEAALDSYETAVRLDPRYGLAWNNRGNTLRRLGRLPEALDSYERALAQHANSPEAWCHRAIVLNDLGRHADAAASADRALALRPAYADALQALGNALQALERFGDAVQAYDRALALAHPIRQPEIWCARGAALKKSGELEAALASYEQALTLRSDYALAEHYRANVLRALGRREDAVQAYWRARDLGADPTETGFALAALGEGAAPSSAPADYVKNLFDQYAGHFDRHLVGVLGYRTPELLASLLQTSPGMQVTSALDLGCGTGLCAPLLRPMAKHLAGVDLSEKMLEKARATGLYDELACADILPWLTGRRAEWDLVTAADVLVYFGDLAPLFEAVAGALRPGGQFAFSVEALAPELDTGAGYAITASNRFAHAPAYVQACAAAAGLQVLGQRDAALRQEHGKDVIGMLFLLGRS